MVYRGVEVGLHRLDLYVPETIVVERKTVKALHFAIARLYLRAIGRWRRRRLLPPSGQHRDGRSCVWYISR